ncbi:hypothetical protein FKM82_006134 [Ascaphus truei]
MQGARKWHALLALSLLLITSSVQGNSEAEPRERRTLLDLLVQAIGDNNNNKESAKVISRRYSEGAAYSADQDNHRLSSRERTVSASKLSSRRPIGPVTFSAECNKHFHRLYHNTRDCSTPAYYKRCARLLTRLAMSPLCSQP